MKHKTKVGRNDRKTGKRLFLFVFSLFFMLNMSMARDLTVQPSIMEKTTVSPELQGKLYGFFNDFQAFTYNPCTSDEVRDIGRLVLELDGKQREIHLRPINLLAPNIQRTVTKPVYTYKGYVVGEEGSRVRLTVAPYYFGGVVRLGDEVFFVEPSARFQPGSMSDMFIIYKSTDVKKGPPAYCGLEVLNPDADRIMETDCLPEDELERIRVFLRGRPWYLVQLALEADDEFTGIYCGSPVSSSCETFIRTRLQDYANRLDDIWEKNLNLRVGITHTRAYTDSSPDVYNADYAHGPVRLPGWPSTCVNPETGIWERFRDHWTSDQSKIGIPREVAVLFTGRDLWLCPGVNPTQGAWDLYGTAGLDKTVCNNLSNAFVVMEEYTKNTAGLMAHEIGHSLGFASHDSLACCSEADSTTGPVLCGTVESGSDKYSENSVVAIRGHLEANNMCLDVLQPNISVHKGVYFVPMNSTQTFPDTSPGVPVSLQFTIKNMGSAGLEIDNPTALVSGSGYFQQTGNPADLVYGAESTTFTIRFLSSVPGTHTAQVTVSSNDPDEDPYSFTITGTVQSPTQTVEFPAVADAWVYQKTPYSNYGYFIINFARSTHSLQGCSTYIKFTVSGVTGPIQSATLKIKTYNYPFPSSRIYHIKNTTWGENTITWNNAPLEFYTQYALGALDGGKWQEIDVTNRVTGNGTYTFGFTAADVQNLAFWSRESADKPTLIVTY
jgi:hypothetical protein